MTNMGKCACDMYTSSLFLKENESLVLYMKLKIQKNVKN
ncbi:unknown [Segatella copri CAG:164]|nr:unknown [Segatella copri CAG:164]